MTYFLIVGVIAFIFARWFVWGFFRGSEHRGLHRQRWYTTLLIWAIFMIMAYIGNPT